MAALSIELKQSLAVPARLAALSKRQTALHRLKFTQQCGRNTQSENRDQVVIDESCMLLLSKNRIRQCSRAESVGRALFRYPKGLFFRGESREAGSAERT